jgi:hypothetical protein
MYTLTLVYKLLLSSFFIAPFASVYTTFLCGSMNTLKIPKSSYMSRDVADKKREGAIHVNIFSNNVTTKYLVILHCAGANVSRTSNL